MATPFEESPGRTGMAGQMRRLVYELRTEGGGPAREATAIGLGTYIGCSPFYGFHLLICIAAGWMFRLNRLKLYVAANISNPLVAPFLILSELETGALIRRGEIHPLTMAAVRQMDPWHFGADVLVGSVVVGAALGLCAGLATYFLTRSGDDDRFYTDLVRRASDRFVTSSITAWEFARGKLRGDPIYRALLTPGVLPGGGSLVDVGCGSGLTLALLAEAAAVWREGSWPAGVPAPPVFANLLGIEKRPRVARLAQRALGASAVIIGGDARDHAPPDCHVVLFFDVLHMMPRSDQERLVASMADVLRPDGVILVREADAAAGRRFRAVRAGNRVKAILFGHWRQRFDFRTAAEWTACFERLGFVVERCAAGEGTPFGNTLFVLRRPRDTP